MLTCRGATQAPLNRLNMRNAISICSLIATGCETALLLPRPKTTCFFYSTCSHCRQTSAEATTPSQSARPLSQKNTSTLQYLQFLRDDVFEALIRSSRPAKHFLRVNSAMKKAANGKNDRCGDNPLAVKSTQENIADREQIDACKDFWRVKYITIRHRHWAKEGGF